MLIVTNQRLTWTGICKRYINNITTEKLVPRILYPEINETDAKDSLVCR